jgi:quinol monooxygenase YgiN
LGALTETIILVVTFHATPGKCAELAQAMKARCEISRQDAGCEQFELFQSVRWRSQS